MDSTENSIPRDQIQTQIQHHQDRRLEFLSEPFLTNRRYLAHYHEICAATLQQLLGNIVAVDPASVIKEFNQTINKDTRYQNLLLRGGQSLVAPCPNTIRATVLFIVPSLMGHDKLEVLATHEEVGCLHPNEFGIISASSKEKNVSIEDIEQHISLVRELILLIEPKVLVMFGAELVTAMLQTPKKPIDKLRGSFYSYHSIPTIITHNLSDYLEEQDDLVSKRVRGQIIKDIQQIHQLHATTNRQTQSQSG